MCVCVCCVCCVCVCVCVCVCARVCEREREGRGREIEFTYMNTGQAFRSVCIMCMYIYTGESLGEGRSVGEINSVFQERPPITLSLPVSMATAAVCLH